MDIAKKRDRKANFSVVEVRCLLEGIGEEKDAINCKLQNTTSARRKREAWERVRVKVNSVSGGVIRSQDDLRRKWKDLKAAVMKELSHQKKTGSGSGPIKGTPFKDLIVNVLGDRSESVLGIKVSGADSFTAQTAKLETPVVNTVSASDSFTAHTPKPEIQVVNTVSASDSFTAQTAAPDTQVVDTGLSTDEKYFRAFTVCTQLAMIISKGSVEAFYVRIDLLEELCSAWTNENCTSLEADSSPKEALQLQIVQDIKLECDDGDDYNDDDAPDYKSDDDSTNQTTAPDDTERCEAETTVGHQSVERRSELVDSEDVQSNEYDKDCSLLTKPNEQHDDDDGPVKCDLCEKVFETGKLLRTHMNGHRQEKSHTCTICGKEYAWKGALTAHLKTHREPNTQLTDNSTAAQDGSPHLRETVLGVPCAECGEIFLNAWTLERHVKGHALENPATCEVCGKEVKKAKYLREHMKIHEQRNFTCEICGSLCTSQYKLNMHMRRHERKFVCSVCGACCATKYNLMEHVNRHTGVKPHSCNMCGKKFGLKQGLQLHMRVHNNDRPFVCTICGKRFVLSTVLKYHMRLHTGEKPYGCSVCNKRYHKGNLLRDHMRLHSGEKPFSCKECGKCFRMTRALQKHSRMHTGEKICFCSICSRGFTASDNLKQHMRTHTGEKPYACVKCECRFMYLATLKKHLKRHSAENDKQAQN